MLFTRSGTDRMQATAKTTLGFPKFSGIDPPQPQKQQPPPRAGAPPGVASGAAAGGPNNVNPQLMMFAMNPTDHAKYHSLFISYDHDKDG